MLAGVRRGPRGPGEHGGHAYCEHGGRAGGSCRRSRGQGHDPPEVGHVRPLARRAAKPQRQQWHSQHLRGKQDLAFRGRGHDLLAREGRQYHGRCLEGHEHGAHRVRVCGSGTRIHLSPHHLRWRRCAERQERRGDLLHGLPVQRLGVQLRVPQLPGIRRGRDDVCHFARLPF